MTPPTERVADEAHGTAHLPPTRAQRLGEDAAEAAQLRDYATHPDVIAVRVERARTQVDRLCWAGITLGLGFTMTNVQSFAAGDSPAGSLPWLAPWLLDPTVSLVLLAILRAEQTTARYQVRTSAWARAAKWLTLSATYVGNTWSSYAAGSASAVVLYSIPLLVVCAAVDAVTDLRDTLIEAALVAERTASVNTGHVHQPALPRPGHEPARRKRFADYLAEARIAWSPDAQVTPAWIRAVTGCSRRLSSRLSAALNAELSTADKDPS